MILMLSESCPIFRPGAEAYLQDLLFTLAVKRRHVLVRPSPDRLRELLPKYLWDLHEVYLRQSSKKAINSRNWIHNANCGSCDVAKLTHYCELPTALIVENLATDGEWVKLIIHKLRPALARQMAGRHVGLELRHAGGIGEIPKELRRVVRRYREALPDQSMPLRVIALADSDAIIPDRPSDNAGQVLQVARDLGALAHILAKRTIENYAPDGPLRTYALHRPNHEAVAIRFIVSLTGPARDHYPMKTGLSDREIDATGSMYPPRTPRDLGVGDFIISFIDDMGPSVKASELRRRDGMQELDAFLDVLEKNL